MPFAREWRNTLVFVMTFEGQKSQKENVRMRMILEDILFVVLFQIMDIMSARMGHKVYIFPILLTGVKL